MFQQCLLKFIKGSAVIVLMTTFFWAMERMHKHVIVVDFKSRFSIWIDSSRINGKFHVWKFDPCLLFVVVENWIKPEIINKFDCFCMYALLYFSYWHTGTLSSYKFVFLPFWQILRRRTSVPAVCGRLETSEWRIASLWCLFLRRLRVSGFFFLLLPFSASVPSPDLEQKIFR